jgi:hypothetical protein
VDEGTWCTRFYGDYANSSIVVINYINEDIVMSDIQIPNFDDLLPGTVNTTTSVDNANEVANSDDVPFSCDGNVPVDSDPVQDAPEDVLEDLEQPTMEDIAIAESGVEVVVHCAQLLRLKDEEALEDDTPLELIKFMNDVEKYAKKRFAALNKQYHIREIEEQQVALAARLAELKGEDPVSTSNKKEKKS